MSHYEERLEKDLARIRESVSGLGAQVEQALRDATEAFLSGDAEKAYSTVLGDHAINRDSREVDKICHAFISRHLPSAGHLRLMSSVIRVNVALERVGDYAVTICRESLQMAKPPKGKIASQLKMLAEEAQGLLQQSVQSFIEDNEEQARALMPATARIENMMDDIYDRLIENRMQKKPRDAVADFVVFGLLKRISDQAKNICDQTVFAVSGEGKPTKIFNILFVDEDNSLYSQMAAAMARKRFPHAAQFESAGRQPVSEPDSALLNFLDDHGVKVEDAATQSIESLELRLPSFDIVIALQGEATDYIPKLPFHCAALHWDIAAPSASGGEQPAQELDKVYRDLGPRIDDLMHMLAGPDAD